MTNDQFERLAQIMKEGVDETHARIDDLESSLSAQILGVETKLNTFREETNANFLEIRGQ